MGLQEIDVERDVAAAPEALWALLGDSSTWPTWTPIEEHTALRAGGVDGVGELREFKTGRVRVREEVVERRPPERLVYELRSGLAVRDYRAEIDLTPGPGGGTHLRWHTTFRPKVPGTGPLYRRALLKATRSFVDGLADAAAA